MRCGPDLGGAAADRQPLDGRGDGKGRWHRRLKEIVGLYVNPPNHAIVLSVDENNSIGD